MKIYPCFSKLIDVFKGDGWYNWSRWRLINGDWIQVGGEKVNNKETIVKLIKEKLNEQKALGCTN